MNKPTMSEQWNLSPYLSIDVMSRIIGLAFSKVGEGRAKSGSTNSTKRVVRWSGSELYIWLLSFTYNSRDTYNYCLLRITFLIADISRVLVTI